MAGELSGRRAVEELVADYPEIADELKDETWAGFLYLEIGVFLHHTQQQIDQGNREELVRCYNTARSFFMEGEPDLNNAISVSYLEHLNFRDGKRKRSWAKELLPEPLATDYRDVMQYLEDLGSQPPN